MQRSFSESPKPNYGSRLSCLDQRLGHLGLFSHVCQELVDLAFRREGEPREREFRGHNT
jgi:hypothetical protein